MLHIKSFDVQHMFSAAFLSILLLTSLLYVFLAEFISIQTADVYTERRILLCFLMAVIVIAYFLYNFYRYWDRESVWLVLSTLWGMVVFAGKHWDVFSAYGWVELGFWAVFFPAVFALGEWIKRSYLSESGLFLLIFFSALLAAIYAVASFYIYVFALMDDVPRLVDYLPWGFVNIRYWSHVATWFLPLLPLAILWGPLCDNKLWRICVYFTGAFWSWLLLLSMSRGSLLSLIVSAFFVVVVFRRASWCWLRVMTIFFVLGMILLVSLNAVQYVFVDGTISRNFHTGSSGRWSLWLEAWAMSLVNFPFGMGAGSWLVHEPLTEGFNPERRFGHPHNMYLFWAAEYGWFLVICILFGFYSVAKRMIYRVKKINKKEYYSLPVVSLLASLSAALVHACFSAVFIAPASMLLGFFVLAFCWAWGSDGEKIKPFVSIICQGISNVKIKVVIVSVLSMFLIFWLFLLIKYYNAVYSEIAYGNRDIIGINSPRFWTNSHIPIYPEPSLE